MADITQFILRFYYFFETELQPLERLAEVLSNYGMHAWEQNKVIQMIDQQALYFRLNCSHAKMTVLAVKTAHEDQPWIEGLKHLQEWEEQAGLRSDELMGKLTVLAGLASQWSELMEQACTLLPMFKKP